MRFALAIAVFFGLGGFAFAEETSRADFNAFFEKAMGSWLLTLEDFDETGTLTYQGEQERIFTWGIANRYAEERAFVTREGRERVYLGLMLYSLDEERAKTLMLSFWPRSPRRWAEFEGEVSGGAHPTLSGVLKSFRDDGIERQRRVEIEFESSDRFVFLNFAQNSEGKEYLVERLTYTRKAEAN
ncbi:MAG TPA: hypothetical protein VD713_07490 [Sphingomonadales bacterium]|nr:hypothetical protein [Sphingomonadales bacterium]